jgi:hypothetical protein
MLALIAGLVVFHLFVLIGVIPYGVVWGGRLEDTSEMWLFEVVSIVILILVAAVVATRGGHMHGVIPERGVVPLLWMLVVLFVLNTVGNLFAATMVETVVFTPFTLASAVLCARIAIGPGA